MSPYLTISRNWWQFNSSPDLLKLKKEKEKKIGDAKLCHLIYWNWKKKKNIWWRNNSSLKIRFSDEKLMPPIIFYWWRKNFVTYHFLIGDETFSSPIHKVTELRWRMLFRHHFVTICIRDEIKTYYGEIFLSS